MNQQHMYTKKEKKGEGEGTFSPKEMKTRLNPSWWKPKSCYFWVIEVVWEGRDGQEESGREEQRGLAAFFFQVAQCQH